MKKALSIAILGTLLSLSTGTVLAADAAAGAKLFKKKCKTCHTVEAGKKHRTGPNLAGMLTRPAGTAEGYKYSKGLAASGINWDDATMDQWLTNPKKMVKGTKMVLKLKKEKERQNMIAYLKEIGG